MERFDEDSIKYVPRVLNKKLDTVAMVASRIYIPGEKLDVRVIKKELPSTVLDLFPKEDTND